MPLFFIISLTFLLSFILFGFVVGRTILRRFNFYSLEETCSFSIVTGWVFFALFIMVLGFAGFFQPSIILAVSTIIFIYCFYLGIRNGYFYLKNPALSFKAYLLSPFGVLILIFLALLFYVSLYPVTNDDAIFYILPAAKAFITQGKIAVIPSIRYPVYPYLIELFFAIAFIFHNTIFANLISCGMAIALAFLIYSFGKRFVNKEAGLFSSMLFLSSPAVIWYGLVPMVEGGATLFCFSAFYAMCIWLDEKKLSFAILSGIFWGLAFGSKYFSIFFFAVSLLSLIIIYNKKIRIDQSLYLVLIAIAIAFPWYLHNKIFSGDWFFPMLPITGLWDAKDVRFHLGSLRPLGLESNFQTLCRMPINLIFPSPIFWGGNIGPIILGMLSVIFVKKWSRIIGLCTVVVFTYFFIWFYRFPEDKFLFPILPLLALLAGWALQQANDFINPKKQPLWTCLIITILLYGCFNCMRIIKHFGHVPVTASQKSNYLGEKIPAFQAISFLNNVVQDNNVIYALYNEETLYYKCKVIGDWYGFAAYKKVLPYLDNPEILHKVLTGYGARYFFINRTRLMSNDHLSIKSELLKSKLFKLLYSDPQAYVFEVL